MILEEVRSIEIQSDIEGVKGGISTDSLPFMFRILSKSYYSRKIDSIVRELTSNCFDSHVEAGITEPVIIQRRYDIENNNYNIVFKDVGVGMNPERMNKVFNQWFTSTKRGSNDYIGAFGLGSKSPFSYTDNFNIVTVHNNLKYDYEYVLGSSLPELISNYGYDENQTPIGIPTDERNGTEIIINLLSNNDSKAFEEAIKKELCYFDDVYVSGFNYINNDYSIYRKESFLFRPETYYSSELHIVLGKCCYPIDWKAINRERIDLPFGVIFDIGELQVTPNRESLIYDASDDTSIADLINSKINNVLKEVNDLISKGSDSRETDDLKFYLNNKDRKPRIWFGSYTQDIPIKYIIDKNVALQFTPFKHLPITIPSNPFFYYNKIGEINGENITRYETHNFIGVNLFQNNYIRLDTETNQYTNANIEYANIIKRDSIKNNYHNIARKLGLYTYRKGYRNQYSLGVSGDPHYDYHREPIEKGSNKEKWVRTQMTLGKAKIIREYLKYIDDLANVKITNYSSYTPSDAWIKDYKEAKRKRSSAYLKKLEGKITIVTDSGTRATVKLADLKDYTNVIYYITEKGKVERNKEVSSIINKLSNIKSIGSEFTRGTKKTKTGMYNRIIPAGTITRKEAYWKKHYKFIGISNSTLPMLQTLDNIVPLDVMNKFPLFDKYDRLKSNYRVLQILRGQLRDYSSFIKGFHLRLIDERIFEITDKFIDINEYPLGNFKCDEDISKLHDFYIKELKKLEILQYINIAMPNKFLLPITSKLKSNILKPYLLSINPTKHLKERVINQTAII